VRPRTIPGRLALVVVALAAALGSGAPAAAKTQLVADHLARPRGLALAPDGTLYATLVGNGGRRCNFEGCFGASGRVVRVSRRGAVSTVASGLLSMRGKPDGFFSLGADQLTMLADGRLATAVSAEFNGLGGKPPAAVPRRLRSQIGRIVLVRPGRRKQLGPDVAAVEYRFDPDGEGEVSNPFGIAAIGDVLYVSDSAANDLLEVRDGAVGLLATFPHTAADVQSVPDALTAGPDGALYVGEYTGGSQQRGTARIWRVVPGSPPTLFAAGLTTITALAFGPDRSLYVAEFARGDIVRIAPGGQRTVVARHLRYPGGLAVARDGTVYASNWTVAGSKPAKHGRFKGRTGQILRVR
jgi:sugar lactone lactonase YvrE